MAIPLWVWKLAGILVMLLAIWFGVQRVLAWHDAYKELPTVQKALKAEVDCEKGSNCDKTSEARAAKAVTDAALAATAAVASAAAGEEAARRDAEAWRLKYRTAVRDDPDCATWAAQAVRCPL